MVNKFNSFENSDDLDHSDDLDIFQRGLISVLFGHWRGDSTINNDSYSAKEYLIQKSPLVIKDV